MPNEAPYEIDFASISKQAGDYIDANPATESVTEPVVEPAAPVEAQAVTPPQVDTPVVKKTEITPEPASPSAIDELDPEKDGDKLVKVKVDGEWKTIALKEVANGYSRTSHFTRKMQDLATDRNTFTEQQTQFKAQEAEFTQLKAERQNIDAFLRNPKLMYQFLKESDPSLFAAAEATPSSSDEIATVAQAKEIVEQRLKDFNARLEHIQVDADKKVTEKVAELERSRETQEHAVAINAHVKDLFVKNPILNKVRRAEDVIRYEVALLKPQTREEALEAFNQVVQGMVEDLDEGFKSTNTKQVVKQAAAKKLESSRIEPPGGSGPQIQPQTNFMKSDGGVDWNAIRKAAEQV
jgi:hypothetical protein